MKLHNLKTDLDVFIAVRKGFKTYEIRFDDRDFKLYDLIRLKATEYSGNEMKNKNEPLIYTGQQYLAQIKHILRGPIYGLADGWVILSLGEEIQED